MPGEHPCKVIQVSCFRVLATYLISLVCEGVQPPHWHRRKSRSWSWSGPCCQQTWPPGCINTICNYKEIAKFINRIKLTVVWWGVGRVRPLCPGWSLDVVLLTCKLNVWLRSTLIVKLKAKRLMLTIKSKIHPEYGVISWTQAEHQIGQFID